MVTLFQKDCREENRHSSKGNQLKWMNNDIWYKADYMGYEGLAEYVTSHILQYSNIPEEDYILYNTEEIQYGATRYLGCFSRNFLPQGWQMITLERLFQNYYGESLYRSIYQIQSLENRARFLVEQTERITGLQDFGEYLVKLLTVDALFLNEDRHTHNIAVLMDEMGKYYYCPIFDNGGALLSDTTMDYPVNGDIFDLIDSAKAKTLCDSFDEQLEVVERLYGQNIKFSFGRKEVEAIVSAESYYPHELKERVTKILLDRKRKYEYLF